MNNKQFIQVLSVKTKLKPRDISYFLKILKQLFSSQLSRGRKIHLSGLGSFLTLPYPPRKIINPRNPLQRIFVPTKNVLKFHPSFHLHQKIKNLRPSIAPSARKETVARPLHIPYVDLTKKTIPKEILSYIPEHMARHYQVVPIDKIENRLILAMIDPEDQEAIEFAKKKSGLRIEPRLCSQEDLVHVLDQYAALEKEVEEIIEEKEIEVVKAKKPGKMKIPKAEELSESAPAAKIVSSLLRRAVRDKASDIHIEPEEEETIVRFRIDGVLHKTISLPQEIHPAVISRIKILSNLKIDETRLPQDGRFQTIIDQKEVDFRVSILPIADGEKAVLRILDKSIGLLSLEQLGLRKEAFKILDDNIRKAHGMILATGPTGSGKTTTLYAIIDRIMDVGINIITLEDPIEYRIKGINQSQVNNQIGYTFANGLRSIVRQDPDVVMIGEIRDFETANMAIHAALTGHIVLSTLHTNDAVGAIPRLIDIKIEPFLISSTANAIIAQRLCRRICQNCREKIKPPLIQIEEIKKELAGLKSPFRSQKTEFYQGKGCPVCNQTGYKGRVGIFEILGLSEEIKNLANKKASADALHKQAIKEGMITLKQDGMLKVLEGTTTLEEVLRVTRD